MYLSTCPLLVHHQPIRHWTRFAPSPPLLVQPTPHDKHDGAGVVIGFIFVCMVCLGALGAILAVLKHFGYLQFKEAQIGVPHAASAAAPKTAVAGTNKVGPSP